MGLELGCLSEGDGLPKALPLASQNGFKKLGILHIQEVLLFAPPQRLHKTLLITGVSGILIAWLLCMVFI